MQNRVSRWDIAPQRWDSLPQPRHRSTPCPRAEPSARHRESDGECVDRPFDTMGSLRSL